WIQHLRNNVPSELRGRLYFRRDDELLYDRNGFIYYPESSGAVQVRVKEGKDAQGRPRYTIMFWQPGTDAAELEPLATWFWKESPSYFRNTPVQIDSWGDTLLPRPDDAIIEVQPAGANDEGKPLSRYVIWPGAASGDGSVTLADAWHREAARLPAPVEIDV